MANGNGSEPAIEPANEAAVTVVNTLSIMIVAAYIIMMPLWMFWPPNAPAEILAIINQMTGAWQMAFATVVAYHLGSTKNSARSADASRETIKSLANTAASTAASAATAANTAAVVAAAPAAAAAAGNGTQPTTVTTTTETRVDPAGAAAAPRQPDDMSAVLDAAAATGSVRSLDTARENMGPTVPEPIQWHYEELRARLVAQLQSGNTPPKS